jgi:hypothetical protein
LVSYTGGVLYPSADSRDSRKLKYSAAAEALEKYLQLEKDPRAAQAWKEQLQTLKFFLGQRPITGDTYMGRDVTTQARLRAKPVPISTERARAGQVRGTLGRRCVFASEGTVNHIQAKEALPAGLTEQAIAAAKQIKFIPATRDGKPVSMWMQLEYNFNLF